MSKGKLAKFADMEALPNVFQFPYSWFLSQQPSNPSPSHIAPHPLAGRWREQYFHNDNPIILELGCGRGEYTVGLSRMFPRQNFIGVDIKGSRMWSGAMQAQNEGLANAAFLRTNIEIIDRFFAPGEVQEIWLTFSDPQMKNPRKRLTSTYFLERYRRFLVPDGIIHLKTDSRFLYTYTTLMAEANHLPILFKTEDLYSGNGGGDATESAFGSSLPLGEQGGGSLSIQTYYEQMWLGRGISIKYLMFQLPQEGALIEPDVEIELDDYRSYHRDKRSPKTTNKR